MIESDCHCCAERKLIRVYLNEYRKKGFHISKFPKWLHRKHGNLVIWRPRKDGIMGASLPCVLCRKAVEKYHIQWIAYDGQRWVRSGQDELPRSKPTHKQRKVMKFS